ncbi:hypothetical protein DICVIV_06803 [Dictyocaulus viviparus]|uniref:Uncharacterized protein n=1 Tax=Dictyocaulus viviparus TaxID=29172 RepID=A0A0D8XRF0_DICVI|nr:hypothetical protein DICVIV_06803 [Dictyocaulus viviparus]
MWMCNSEADECILFTSFSTSISVSILTTEEVKGTTSQCFTSAGGCCYGWCELLLAYTNTEEREDMCVVESVQVVHQLKEDTETTLHWWTLTEVSRTIPTLCKLPAQSHNFHVSFLTDCRLRLVHASANERYTKFIVNIHVLAGLHIDLRLFSFVP